MTAVMAVVLCVLPFAACLVAAQIQLGRERYRAHLFERQWRGHNEHEFVRHPVYGHLVCRYCPMTPARP